jgi:two-component system phosphate regulon sensor histidine kinase PhoR
LPRKRLIWQIFPLFVLVAAGSLVLAAFYATQTMGQIYQAQRRADLEARARLIASTIGNTLFSVSAEELNQRCAQLSKAAAARVTIILPSGTVLADSDHDSETMDNHADRPEVIDALAGRVGNASRYSYTLKTDLSYVAFPIYSGTETIGIVRIAVPEPSVRSAVRATSAEVATGMVLVAFVVTALSFIATRSVTRPVEQLRRGAERFANGELESRLAVPNTAELGLLANTMNTMAIELSDRIHTVERHRNELQAVLSSMVEGVIAFDSDERVISLNRAVADMFDVPRDHAVGRMIHEVFRNVDLQRFVTSILATGEPQVGSIALELRGEEHLQLQCAALHDAQGNRIGGLVVLHDITRLHRLETARRDFVSNVSHELKTPITSITGYVETLLDGALEDPVSARKFLEIIRKQADRLTALIEDLLQLSRIEQNAEEERLPLEQGPLREVLDRAVQACELTAASKSVTVELRCDDDVNARMNAPLLQRAFENLLENAIKYSDDGTKVIVEASREPSYIVIAMTDQGCGIAQEHLARIFERFYRVDQARSRKLGGTGLGLAIVKHIVRVHGGKTTVESVPGKGSTFRIHLPIQQFPSPQSPG